MTKFRKPLFFASLFVLLAAGVILCVSGQRAMANPPGPASAMVQPVYQLRLFALHGDDGIHLVYRRGNEYIPSAIHRLDYFLRDDRNGDVYRMKPKLFDLLHALLVKLHRPNAVIDVICGYRTPQTNQYLREHTVGVAKHSLHMLGEAIDIRIPGVPLWKVRQAALALHRGGVGYYPRSDFVHVDIGRVRQWELK